MAKTVAVKKQSPRLTKSLSGRVEKKKTHRHHHHRSHSLDVVRKQEEDRQWIVDALGLNEPQPAVVEPEDDGSWIWEEDESLPAFSLSSPSWTWLDYVRSASAVIDKKRESARRSSSLEACALLSYRDWPRRTLPVARETSSCPALFTKDATTPNEWKCATHPALQANTWCAVEAAMRSAWLGAGRPRSPVKSPLWSSAEQLFEAAARREARQARSPASPLRHWSSAEELHDVMERRERRKTRAAAAYSPLSNWSSAEDLHDATLRREQRAARTVFSPLSNWSSSEDLLEATTRRDGSTDKSAATNSSIISLVSSSPHDGDADDEDDVTPFSSSSSSTDSSSSSTDSSQFHSSASIRDSMQSLEDESECMIKHCAHCFAIQSERSERFSTCTDCFNDALSLERSPSTRSVATEPSSPALSYASSPVDTLDDEHIRPPPYRTSSRVPSSPALSRTRSYGSQDDEEYRAAIRRVTARVMRRLAPRPSFSIRTSSRASSSSSHASTESASDVARERLYPRRRYDFTRSPLRSEVSMRSADYLYLPATRTASSAYTIPSRKNTESACESLYPRRRRHYYARASVATSVDSRPIRSVQSSSSSVVVLKELKSKSCQTTTQGVRADSRQDALQSMESRLLDLSLDVARLGGRIADAIDELRRARNA